MIVEIITTENVFLRTEAEQVLFPGSNGKFAVLHNHAPMLAMLDEGVLKLTNGGSETGISISSGFVRILHNVITVCVERAKYLENY